MESIMIQQDNIEMIEEELDYALGDCYGAPMHLVVEIVLDVLDAAEREGRLNARERRVACSYIKENYGYDF